MKYSLKYYLKFTDVLPGMYYVFEIYSDFLF